ncbi:MAG: hypothetical protein ACRDI3_02780 [Actinomycetota bacterium]
MDDEQPLRNSPGGEDFRERELIAYSRMGGEEALEKLLAVYQTLVRRLHEHHQPNGTSPPDLENAMIVLFEAIVEFDVSGSVPFEDFVTQRIMFDLDPSRTSNPKPPDDGLL